MWVYRVFSISGNYEEVDSVFTNERKAIDYLESQRNKYSYREYRIGHYFAV